MRAGTDLSTEVFVKAMESLTAPPDIFGNPEMGWTGTRRLGSNQTRLSQIVDGRWKVVTDYARP
jgi:branched-chain amino acid transport system substrate-binding protein